MFFDDINLVNCPESFALNCKNYETLCSNCKANKTGPYLKYSPINKSISNHPASIKQKSKSASFSRRGRQKEKNIINNNDFLTSTYASGSLAGDGDAFIELGSHKIRVEIKTRFKDFDTRYTPTMKELKEGATQDIKIWYIGDESGFNKFCYIDANLFTSFLRYAFLHNDSTIVGTGPYLLKHLNNSIAIYTKKLLLKRGTRPKIKMNLDVYFYYVTNNLGTYVLCSSSNFENLLTIIRSLINNTLEEIEWI